MATTSKEGSRRANYPILTQGGSDNKYQCRFYIYGGVQAGLGVDLFASKVFACHPFVCNWNENKVNILSRTDWRASLVPAAAVIPAPIAYIKVVAVKKLVVGFDCCGVCVGVCVVFCVFERSANTTETLTRVFATFIHFFFPFELACGVCVSLHRPICYF